MIGCGENKKAMRAFAGIALKSDVISKWGNSKIKLFNDSLECLAALQELFYFFRGEVGHNVALNGTVADKRRKREADIAESVFAVEHCRNHEGRAVNTVQGITDHQNSRGNSVIGASLAANDLGTRGTDVIFDLIAVNGGLGTVFDDQALGVVNGIDTRDVADRPRNEGRVTVLAKDVSMHTLLRYAEGTGNVGAQTSGVKQCTSSENLGFGKTGHLDKRIGQYVNGIRNHDIGCIRANSRDLRSDLLQNIDIGLRQLKTGLIGLTGKTGGDDYDMATLCVLIIAGININRVIHKRSTMINVECFAECFVFIDIDKNDFGSNPLQCEGVSGCGTDAACADDGDFAVEHKDLLPFVANIVELNCAPDGSHTRRPGFPDFICYIVLHCQRFVNRKYESFDKNFTKFLDVTKKFLFDQDVFGTGICQMQNFAWYPEIPFSVFAERGNQ